MSISPSPVGEGQGEGIQFSLNHPTSLDLLILKSKTPETMTYTLKFCFPLFLFLALSSCKQTDNLIDPTPGENSMTAVIDGNEFAVSGIPVTANYSVVSDTIHTLAVAAATPPFDGVTEGIALALVSIGIDSMQAGDVFIVTSLERRAGAEYFLESPSQDISATAFETDIATVTITAIDYEEKLVSGIFSFDAGDRDDSTKVYQIRDGVFTDVSLL